MAKEFYPGSSVNLVATFTVDGVVTDPTAITLIVTAPDGTENTYTYGGGTITKDSTGVYSKNITLSSEGTWEYRYVGTGTVIAAREGEVYVEISIYV